MRLIGLFLAYKILPSSRILADRRLKIRQREKIHQIRRRLIKKFIFNEVVNCNRKNRRLSVIVYYQAGLASIPEASILYRHTSVLISVSVSANSIDTLVYTSY